MADKEFSVTISPRAAQMMISHAAFLGTVDENAAQQIKEEFVKTAGSLSRLPYRGKRLEKPFADCDDYRYLIFSRWYLLVYTIEDNEVYVDQVIDGRQDYRWLFA